jgi:hypothetical protein
MTKWTERLINAALCLLGGMVGGAVVPILQDGVPDPLRPAAAGVLRTGRIELIDGQGRVNAILSAVLASSPAAFIFVDENGRERLRLGPSPNGFTPSISISGSDNKRRLWIGAEGPEENPSIIFFKSGV